MIARSLRRRFAPLQVEPLEPRCVLNGPGLPQFVPTIDNPFLPYIPGTVFVYQGSRDGNPEVDVEYVTHQTKRILGVDTTVIFDVAFVNGQLFEKTFDWYAQDTAGNVWYFGEDTALYQDGKVISTEGSWQGGVHGALPGIIMEAHPQVGDSYAQEHAPGVAEDMAAVLSLSETVSVPFGTFSNCLLTNETTPLDPGAMEHKYYAAGVGEIMAVDVAGGSDASELVAVFKVGKQNAGAVAAPDLVAKLDAPHSVPIVHTSLSNPGARREKLATLVTEAAPGLSKASVDAVFASSHQTESSWDWLAMDWGNRYL